MSLFQRLRRKLRMKKKKEDKPVSKREPSSIPEPVTEGTPGAHLHLNPALDSSRNPSFIHTHTESTTEPVPMRPQAPQVKVQNKAEPPPIFSEQNLSPYSVTMAERARYQKIVLKMTDEEIRNALPPGQYGVTLVADRPPRPEGRGDLAYAYMEPAS